MVIEIHFLAQHPFRHGIVVSSSTISDTVGVNVGTSVLITIITIVVRGVNARLHILFCHLPFVVQVV